MKRKIDETQLHYEETLYYETDVDDRLISHDLLSELTSKYLDNPGELQDQLDKAAAKYNYWSMLVVDAEGELEYSKIKKDVWYSGKMTEGREELSIEKPKSYVVSDNAAKQWVFITYEDDMWAIERDVISKTSQAKKFKAIKDAWDRRIMILQSLLKAQIALIEKER